MFSGEKPEVNHIIIFGSPVYVHVPREKRSNLDSSGKTGIFVGYSESSKAYRVYIPGFRQINTSRDVTFDEDAAFNRSRPNHTDEVHDEDFEAPRVTGTDSEEHDPEDHDMTEHQKPENSPKEVITHKRRPTWARELIQDAEKYGAPDGSLRESKRPRTYSSCVALLSDIIDAEPSSFKEAVEKKVWKDAMLEEY